MQSGLQLRTEGLATVSVWVNADLLRSALIPAIIMVHLQLIYGACVCVCVHLPKTVIHQNIMNLKCWHAANKTRQMVL